MKSNSKIHRVVLTVSGRGDKDVETYLNYKL